MNLTEVMEKADEAYSEVIEHGGSIAQAATAYLITSMAGRSGDAFRIQAARYVTLSQCYLVTSNLRNDDEFIKLWNAFHGMRWNYSMVELFARTGENSATREARPAPTAATHQE